MKKSAIGLWLVVLVQALVLLIVIFSRAFERSQFTRAPKKAVFSDVNGGLKMALKMFKEDCGRFPTTAEGWKALMEPPTNDLAKGWGGPYLDQVPVDPWGHEYVYCCPAIYSTNGYDLYSLGPDGVDNSGDEIANWLTQAPPAAPAGTKQVYQVYKTSFMDDAREFVIFIPIFFVLRIIAGFTSRDFQTLAEQNPMADLVWFALVAIAIMIILTPNVAGR